MGPRVVGVYVGLPQDIGDGIVSGIHKSPVCEIVWVGRTSIEGDGQGSLAFHGGPDRSVLMFGHSRYALYASLLGIELPPCAFGENLTVTDLTEDAVCLGDVYRVGDVLLEVSQPRLPCATLARRLDCPAVVQTIIDHRSGGWYLRTLEEGALVVGDTVDLVERKHPEWSVARAFEVFLGKSPEDKAALNEVPCLSQLWHDRLGS